MGVVKDILLNYKFEQYSTLSLKCLTSAGLDIGSLSLNSY